MSVLSQYEEEVAHDVQKGSFMHFHRRFVHLNFETIIRMAQDPASCIILTDQIRENCLACDQGKQTKYAQSRKDTGNNSPIDVVGGVICSDFKGPTTPKDSLGH